MRVNFDPGYVSPKHTHPGGEIIYVLKGTLEYQIGHAGGALQAGDVPLVPAGAEG